MTGFAGSTAVHRRPGAEVGLLVLAAVVFVALLLWASGSRTASLGRSVVGFDGLVAWLRAEGHPAQRYDGFGVRAPQNVGLRVLPIFDAAVDVDRPITPTIEDRRRAETEIDISAEVIRRKIALLPTLVVLPKWRAAVRMSGNAHPAFLNREASVTASIDTVTHGLGTLATEDAALSTFSARGLVAELYLARVLTGSSCTPVIGSRDAMVLGACESSPKDGEEPSPFWLLTDPDLFSNHGLRLGENAALAASLLPQLAEGKSVLVDYTSRVWADTASPGQTRDREWSDLFLYFAAPFDMLWAGLAGLAALILWRASVRNAPPVAAGDGGFDATKIVSINAEARLLRLSGHDGALVAAHMRGLLEHAGARVARPGPAGTDAAQRFSQWLARRDPSKANALASCLAEVPENATPEAMLERVAALETLLDEEFNDTGRSEIRH